MTTDTAGLAGDECVCLCHRGGQARHVVACCADCADCRTRISTAAETGHRPVHCAGFAAGRAAVGYDGAFYVAAGIALIVLILVHPLLPAVAHGVIGILVLLWGVFIGLAPSRLPLRPVLLVVLAVNIAAAIALVVVAFTVGWSSAAGMPVALAAAAVTAAFAVWQAIALRKTAA